MGDQFPVDYANTLFSNPYAVFGMKAGYQAESGWSGFFEARNLTGNTYAAVVEVIADAEVSVRHGCSDRARGAMAASSTAGSGAHHMRISDPSPVQTALYRAVWRWHFLAGLFALPFLLNMAVTGGLYLFAPEINHILYCSLEDVPARAAPPLGASALVQKAAEGTNAKVLLLTLPSGPDKSMQMLIRTPSGESQTAFVDPYDGRLIGSIPVGGVMQIVRKIHSWASTSSRSRRAGPSFSPSREFFSGGRAAAGAASSIRATPKYRMFWRDLHAVTGLFASSLVVFLAATGMPWSMVWGNYVQEWTTAAGFGQPKPPVEVVPDWKLAGGKSQSEGYVHGGAAPAGNLPWALEKTVPPESGPTTRSAITLDQALAIFADLGVKKPFSVALPSGPKGAYTATSRPNRVEETRTVYRDQYSGKVLGDVGFAQYGPAAVTRLSSPAV